jgi:uncharacterized membrane protein
MNSKNQKQTNKTNKNIAIIASIAVIILAGIIIVKLNFGGETKNTTSAQGDVIIPISEVTETVKFYPTKVGSTNMEVLAVKASDGSIRTAFNTCQVCNGSPKAYYKQEGDILICQNCGNQFSMDMIEEQRGGCNPVPIDKVNKTDDGTNIVISKDYIGQNASLFTANWKTK